MTASCAGRDPCSLTGQAASAWIPQTGAPPRNALNHASQCSHAGVTPFCTEGGPQSSVTRLTDRRWRLCHFWAFHLRFELLGTLSFHGRNRPTLLERPREKALKLQRERPSCPGLPAEPLDISSHSCHLTTLMRDSRETCSRTSQPGCQFTELGEIIKWWLF